MINNRWVDFAKFLYSFKCLNFQNILYFIFRDLFEVLENDDSKPNGSSFNYHYIMKQRQLSLFRNQKQCAWHKKVNWMAWNRIYIVENCAPLGVFKRIITFAYLFKYSLLLIEIEWCFLEFSWSGWVTF